MEGTQQFGLFCMVLAIVVMFLFVADTWEKDGIRRGYQWGFSDAKANRCMPGWVNPCGDEPEPTQSKKK